MMCARRGGSGGIETGAQDAGKAPLPFGSWGLFLFCRNNNFVAIERGNDGPIFQIKAEGSRPGLRDRQLETHGARAALIGDQIKLARFFFFACFHFYTSFSCDVATIL